MTISLHEAFQYTSAVLTEVMRERRDSIVVHNHQLSDDDKYTGGELVLGAAAYIAASSPAAGEGIGLRPFDIWPWNKPNQDCIDFKPGDPVNTRHCLIKAMQLLVAEVERMDRAAQLAVVQKAGV